MKHLQYGQTPWDNLSREELLLNVQRMYAALTAAHSVMNLCRHSETTGFWDAKRGSGGKALALSAAVIGPVEEEYHSEEIYRCFFRYATQLLFSWELSDFKWTACDTCPNFYGDDDHLAEELKTLGKPCKDCLARGITTIRRKLEWKDLMPRRNHESPR